MSAVSQEAVLVERPQAAIDGSAARSERPRGWLMRRLLLAADLVGLTAAFLFALAVAQPPVAAGDRVSSTTELALFAASLPFWVILARIHSLYDRDEERSDHSTVDDIFGVFQVVTIGTWSFFAVTHLTGLAHPTMTRMVVFWLAAIGLVPLVRVAARGVGRRQAAYVQNVIIVGSGEVARTWKARSSTTASTACGWWALSNATTVPARAPRTWS